MTRLSLAAAALVVLVAAVFAPVRHFEFVDYDDPTFVVDNPRVAGGLTADSARWAFGREAFAAAGGPLTWISHMLDVELFGMTPGPAHIVNAVLHALNAILLLVLLWRLTGRLAASAIVAALFAVHPLHVESVAWISERKDVLSTMWWLLATLAYVNDLGIRFGPGAQLQLPRAQVRGRFARYALVLLLLAAALLSKPAAATAPFVWLLLDFWPLRRVPAGAGWKRWRPLVIEKVPFVAMSIAGLALTLVAQRHIGAVTSTDQLGAPIRVANALVSYVTYLKQAVWPVNLSVFYPYPAVVQVSLVVIAVAFLGAVSMLAWRTRARRPYILVGWCWYLGALVPMLGLVQVGSHAHADRFTYVPLIGIFIAVVWTLEDSMDASRARRSVAIAAATLGIAACAVVARAQVETWQNSETLWRQADAASRPNFRAEGGLAEVARRRGDIERAIAHYQVAVRLAPDAFDFQVNLGALLAARDRVDEAAAAYDRAVALRPGDVASINNLGAMRARQGRWLDAIAQYRRALDARPTYAMARRNLGLAYASVGDLETAIRECLEALRLSPNEAQWHYEVAVILQAAGRTAESVAHLKEALRVDPNHAGARAALKK